LANPSGISSFDLAEERIRMALAAIPGLLREETIGQEEMWVLAHGFCNAFYAVEQALRSAKRKSLERQVFEDWREAGGRAEMDDLLSKFRHKLTHEDAQAPEAVLTWHIDPVHDTEFPVQSYPFIAYSLSIDSEPKVFTFREWLTYCFGWWDEQLRAMKADYASRTAASAAQH